VLPQLRHTIHHSPFHRVFTRVLPQLRHTIHHSPFQLEHNGLDQNAIFRKQDARRVEMRHGHDEGRV